MNKHLEECDGCPSCMGDRIDYEYEMIKDDRLQKKYEEEKKEAMEEMECWQTQEHIKKCEKCKLSLTKNNMFKKIDTKTGIIVILSVAYVAMAVIAHYAIYTLHYVQNMQAGI